MSREITANAPTFDTAMLAQAASLLKAMPGLVDHIGSFATFTVVLDANMVLRDLIYSATYPEKGLTAVRELIRSGLLECWAPTWLESEIQSKLPKIARKKGLPLGALQEEWLRYRAALRWADTGVPPNRSEICPDPKDLPYLKLAEALGARGIVSSDPDIAEMGGRSLDFEFVLLMRRYARAVVVPVSLRIAGTVVPVAALMILGRCLIGFLRFLQGLPPGVKALLIVAVVIAAATPRVRQQIAHLAVSATDWLAQGLAAFQPLIDEGVALSREKSQEADNHLASVTRLLQLAESPAGRLASPNG